MLQGTRRLRRESFEEAEERDLEEWLALTGNERLRIGEELRRTSYPGGDARMERVIELGWLDSGDT